MKINNFSRTKNKQITLSADVAFRGSKAERMYFKTDSKNDSLITMDYSPFLAAVLLPCMKTGEDIVIEGTVSKQLLQNTNKIMKLVESWKIGLRKVHVIAKGDPSAGSGQAAQALKRLPRSAHDDNKRAGVFFSAGVDSFYTYLKNKKSITDLIFVYGFDVPLGNEALFKKLNNVNARIAHVEKKHFITVETNIADIVEKKLLWDFAHGGALAAVALFLGNAFKTVYISGAVRKDKLFPYGTHPDLDKLWSTEKTKLIHDGIEYTRLEKVMKKVAKSDLALKYLHVCTQNIRGKYNCSRCYKCLTTMIELICANALHKSRTFEREINLKEVENMYYDYSLLYNIQGESHLAELKRQDREYALQRAIQHSLVESRKPKPIKKIMKYAAAFDQKYNDRRFYRIIFSMNKHQDRNFLFKLLLQKGVFK